MRLSGKSVLITGAASGIGLATARLIASEGASRLITVDLAPASLECADCGIEQLTGDVADESFWSSADLGRIDHAVINAGIAATAPVAELDFAEWRRILRVNLDGAFLSLRSALAAICDGGSIVTVASAAGIKPERGIAAYAASKAGVIQLTKVAAKEAAARGVRVNTIAPGGVETPIWDAVPMFADRAREVGRDTAFRELAAMATPLGRYAKPEEIAAQIVFLLSDQAATITGAVLVSDGGYTL